MVKQQIKTAVLSLIILLFLLTTTVLLTINSTFLFYPLEVNAQNLAQDVNLTFEQVMYAYHQLMAYLQLPWIHQLQMAHFPDSASGLEHFRDVKHLFVLNHVLFIFSAMIAIPTLTRWWHKKQFWQLYRYFQVGGTLPIIIGLLASLNFDQFFIAFHHVFFRNSNWLFDPSVDPIINVLPESFFMHCFLLGFVLFELLMWGGFLLARRQLLGTKKRSD